MKQALAMKVAAEQAHAAMVQSGWASYSGAARIVLAVVLLAAAGGAVYAGIHLPLPIRLPRPGRTARTLIVSTWVLAIIVLLACAGLGIHHALQEHMLHSTPVDPITPVTFICVGVIFFTIAVSSSHGGWIALVSAAIAAMAALAIFEFPFDLIVMAKTHPIPPDPALFRVVFFAPLLLVDVATLSLLALSPMVRLSRAAFFSFALMLAVFAAWGLYGFGYPSAPLPFALNVVSKILAFVAALCLFLPQRAQASTPEPATGAPTMVTMGR
jgi:hypothetical protein